MAPFFRAWGKALLILSRHRKLWVPFILFGIVELLCLGLVWLAAQPPFSALLAPPIRHFFSDRVLHYPLHLWFLYNAMKQTHLLAAVLAGAYATGLACAMVQQIHEGKRLSLRDAVWDRRVRYGRVVLLWLIGWGIAQVAMKGVIPRLPVSAEEALWVSMGLAIFLQVLFVYAIPASVYRDAIWRKALGIGVWEAIRYPLSTLATVVIPISLLFGFASQASPSRVLNWMASTQVPEKVLGFVAARWLLWMGVEALLTVAVAHLWWFHRAAERANSVHSSQSIVHSKPQKEPSLA